MKNRPLLKTLLVTNALLMVLECLLINEWIKNDEPQYEVPSAIPIKFEDLQTHLKYNLTSTEY